MTKLLLVISMFLLVIAMLLLNACNSSAASRAAGAIELVVINVAGNNSLSEYEIFGEVIPAVQYEYLYRTGFEVELYDYVEVELNKGWLYQFEPYGATQAQRLNWCTDYVREHFKMPPNRIFHCMFPPMQDKELGYLFGGLARNPGQISISQCGRWSAHTPPRDRIPGCYITISHETAHNQSATHLPAIDWAPNIMDPAAGVFVDRWGYELPFHEVSALEMQDYWTRSRRIRSRKLKRRCERAKKQRKCKRRQKRAINNWPRQGAMSLMEAYQ
jgi:hypothetical protein